MKTQLLSGRALELARGFSQRCDELVKKRAKLDEEMAMIQKAAQDDMMMTTEAIKKELGIRLDQPIQIDAEYLDEHGHAYVRVYEKKEEAVFDSVEEVNAQRKLN